MYLARQIHPSPIPPLAHVLDWEAERMREAKERAKMVEQAVRMEKKRQSEDQMCFLCG